MSVFLDRQVTFARPRHAASADEFVPAAVPAHPAAAGTPDRARAARASAARAENFDRCVAAYRDARLRGVNR